jgi:hypothetical protein
MCSSASEKWIPRKGSQYSCTEQKAPFCQVPGTHACNLATHRGEIKRIKVQETYLEKPLHKKGLVEGLKM